MFGLTGFLQRYLSIKVRLLLIFLLPGSIYYGFSTLVSLSHIENISSARIEEIHRVVESAVGETAGHLLNRGLKQDLEEVLKSLVTQTSIMGVVVYDIEKLPFVQVGDLVSGSDSIHLEQDIYHSDLEVEFSGLELNNGVRKGLPKKIGKLAFSIDAASIRSDSWAIIMEDSFLLLITLILCLPIFYALYQSFNQPLSEILRDIMHFEKGDLDWIDRNVSDDLGFKTIRAALRRLATTVLNQTDEIKAANQALQDRASELEEQVKISIQAREEADKANAQKNIFLANVSHEMRQPLVGVVSGAELAEQFILSAQICLKNLSEALAEQLTFDQPALQADLKDAINGLLISKQCSKTLSSMVNDLLASIQDMYEDIFLNPSTFLFYDALVALLERHREVAQQKGLNYKYSIDGLDPYSKTHVRGDWIRISQVINSLIDNAVRFTERGYINISAFVLVSQPNLVLVLSVEDSGVGISEQEKESIFELFHIGEDPSYKKYSGLGIGLNIAQKITRKMHGRLRLDKSKLGIGSRFEFELSLPLIEIQDSLESPIEARPVDRVKKPFILYVEDSSTNRQIFQMYSKLFNIDLILAENGQEGLSRYELHDFDALVVDCYMPVMNGFDFVKEIRNIEKKKYLSPIPIFALTADGSIKNKERCIEAGFDEFLVKPYTTAMFKCILNRLGRNEDILK